MMIVTWRKRCWYTQFIYFTKLKKLFGNNLQIDLLTN